MRRYIWNGQNCSYSAYLKELGEVCVVQWDLYTAGLCPESFFGDWLAFQDSSGLRLHWFNSLRRKYVRSLNEFVPYRCLEVIGSLRKTCFHWQVNWHGLLPVVALYVIQTVLQCQTQCFTNLHLLEDLQFHFAIDFFVVFLVTDVIENGRSLYSFWQLMRVWPQVFDWWLIWILLCLERMLEWGVI